MNAWTPGQRFAYKRALGRRLRDARHARALTLDQAAHASGISAAAISTYETGSRNISAETLWRLASAYRMPVWALLPARTATPNRKAA
jgi:transcriptional regulator with XRE-family HTH domain